MDHGPKERTGKDRGSRLRVVVRGRQRVVILGRGRARRELEYKNQGLET